VEHLIDHLRRRAGLYKAIIKLLQTQIVRNASSTAPDILSATFDLTDSYRTLSFLDENVVRKTIDRYEEIGHCGIAYVLQVRSLVALPQRAFNETQFHRCRRRLLDDWPTTVRTFSLHTSDVYLQLKLLNIDLLANQLFVPNTLWKIPSIRDIIQRDSRSDCLGRSIIGMATDAEYHHIWREQNTGTNSSNVDIFGRDQWYLACCVNDYHVLGQLHVATSTMHDKIWSNNGSVPFAFHIAAAKGEIQVFMFLRRAPSIVWDAVMRAVDEEDNTCLTLAATCGHAELVDLMCHTCSLETLKFISTKKVPLHTAVYNERSEVVECFVKHLSVLDPGALDYASAGRNLPSPFWYAVRSENFYIMQLLEPFADVDRECRGYTPLAMAAFKENSDIIEYLLDLNSSDLAKVRVYVNPITRYGGYDGYTPLDIALDNGDQDSAELLVKHGAQAFKHGQNQVDINDVRGIGLGEQL
jgi:hypothetical protein